MTDLGIDELFKDYECIKVIPKYSRLYCDVERFKDDDKEIMSKYGEGVVYTHLYDGTVFFIKMLWAVLMRKYKDLNS